MKLSLMVKCLRNGILWGTDSSITVICVEKIEGLNISAKINLILFSWFGNIVNKLTLKRCLKNFKALKMIILVCKQQRKQELDIFFPYLTSVDFCLSAALGHTCFDRSHEISFVLSLSFLRPNTLLVSLHLCITLFPPAVCFVHLLYLSLDYKLVGVGTSLFFSIVPKTRPAVRFWSMKEAHTCYHPVKNTQYLPSTFGWTRKNKYTNRWKIMF